MLSGSLSANDDLSTKSMKNIGATLAAPTYRIQTTCVENTLSQTHSLDFVLHAFHASIIDALPSVSAFYNL